MMEVNINTPLQNQQPFGAKMHDEYAERTKEEYKINIC